MEPCGSPPLGWQVPGAYTGGLADLLPRAELAGTVVQLEPVEVSASIKSDVEQAPSLKTETDPAHELPLGAEQAHGEHVRSSLT